VEADPSIPSAPSALFLEADAWARKPDPLLFRWADHIGDRVWDVISEIQEYKQAKRDADMMQAFMGAGLGSK
jgi:hypothetical protein